MCRLSPASILSYAKALTGVSPDVGYGYFYHPPAKTHTQTPKEQQRAKNRTDMDCSILLD